MFKISTKKNFHSNTFEISIDDQQIGNGVYNITSNQICLTWIEINEKYQGNGYGFQALDYFAEKAIEQDVTFKIRVVDDNLLNNFYFKWYKKWSLSENIDEEQIQYIFEQCVIDDSILELEFTPDMLSVRACKQIWLCF